jgi:hypothetical protein
MARVTKTKEKNGSGSTLGFEEKLWAAADKMRGHMDPAKAPSPFGLIKPQGPSTNSAAGVSGMPAH